MVLRINSGLDPNKGSAPISIGSNPAIRFGMLQNPAIKQGAANGSGATSSLASSYTPLTADQIRENMAKANAAYAPGGKLYGPASNDTSPDNPWNRSANTPYEYTPDPNYQAPAETPTPDPGFQGKWADYLAMATKTAGSGVANQLAALAELKNSMNQGYQVGDQQLASMYQALQDQTQQDKAAVAQRYQQALAQSQQNTQQSQAALTGANQSISAEQAASQAALNNQQVDPNGGLTVAQRAQLEAQKLNNAQLQTQGQAQYDSTQNTGNAQQDYMGALGTAAQFAGVDRRAQLKNALMSAMQGIGQQEAQLKDSQGQQANSLAQSMYNNDYNAYKDNRDYQLKMDDAAWQRAYQQQMADNGKTTADAAMARANSTGASGTGPSAALDWLQNSAGLDSNTSGSVVNTLLGGIAKYQGTTSGGGAALSSYQAGQRAIDDAISRGELPVNLKGQAMMALYQMTGSF